MKLSRADIPLLRRNILALCASAIISAAALYSSGQYAEKSLKDWRDAQHRFTDARKRLSAAQDDQQNMSAYSGEYAALEKRNIIGDDQRLDWMEGLENIRQRNLVTDFHYNIAPQKIYAPHAPIERGNFDIRYSEMKLQFDLLHEAQLLDFFTALRSQVNGWYQLDGCALRRASADADAGMAHLTAECSGGWITLKNRSTLQ